LWSGFYQKASETAFGEQLIAGIKLKAVFARMRQDDVIEMKTIGDNLPNIGEFDSAMAFNNCLFILLDVHEFYGKFNLAVAIG